MRVGDGAMGTMLQAVGLPPGACPERWNLEKPTAVTGVHLAFIEAGAAWLQTNTFGATRGRLGTCGLAGRVRDVNAAAVEAARRARPALVLGTLGPTGGEPDEWDRLYAEQVEALAEAGAGGFLVETIVQVGEGASGVRAAARMAAGPVWACFTPGPDGALMDGTEPESAGEALCAAGASVVGVNCGAGPESLLQPARRLVAASLAPVLAAPSAGLPTMVEGRPAYPVCPDAFASAAIQFVEAGVGLLAGCCGTTPGHIRALASALTGAETA